MPELNGRFLRNVPPQTFRRRAGWALGAGLALAALLVPPGGRPLPRLVWNVSASSPIGLYRVAASRPVRVGDWVVAWPPARARALGAARRYLPRNVPLVKRVEAAAGDIVCARGAAVLVNGRRVVVRLRADPAGRPMPWSWSGCATLRGRDVLLLSPGEPLAFDGRYFGISRGGDVLGRATLLWAR